MRIAVEMVRSFLLLMVYYIVVTGFALWPWKRRPPFDLVLDSLGIQGDQRRTSALRLLMLRLAFRTGWESRAPRPIRVTTLGGWALRPFRDTIPECLRLTKGEHERSDLGRRDRFRLFLRAIPDAFRFANGIPSRFWFDPDRRDRAGFHIPNAYHVRTCYLLNQANDPSQPTGQRHFDKTRFYMVCRENGWATVPVYASFEGGRTTEHEPMREGPLFSKPSTLAQGVGRFERWDPEPEQSDGVRRYRGRDDEVVTQTQLYEYLEGLSRRTPYLVQPLLVPHREIRELSGVETLCTLRLPTCCFPDGRVEVLTQSYLRMPDKPGVLMDNRSQGAVAYGLDTSTGRLTLGAWKAGLRTFSVHPASGRTAVGFDLPHFEEAVELATTAHGNAFARFPTVGWDIAITDEGPMLVEMNISWGTEHDIPGEHFLGETAYTECILAHIQRHWPYACP